MDGIEIINRSEVKSSQAIYPAHLSSRDLTTLLKNSQAFVGTIRMSSYSCWKGIVCIRRDGKDPMEIRVAGSLNINRAVDGDQVCVRLLSSSDAQNLTAAHVAQDSLEPEANGEGDDNLALSGDGDDVQGKIVGIVKRNWKTYCGSIRAKEARGDERQLVPANARIPVIIIKVISQ